MDYDVIPSFLSWGSNNVFDGEAFTNFRLRPGEIIGVYYPEDPENVSKSTVEYRVLVQHRANGTTVTKVYDHAVAADWFGGQADTCMATYRCAQSRDSVLKGKGGIGSKVLLLCINGESHNAVIIGGIKDASTAPAKKEDGHHLHFRFNGIDVSINKDGELTLTYQGAQNADGTKAESVDEAATGTTVKISKNGNFSVADKESKNVITLDHATGKIQITSENEVDVTAPKVKLGDADASQPAVLGNQWKSIMEDLIRTIQQITVPTSTGPSGPPINSPVFQKISVQLRNALSGTVYEK